MYWFARLPMGARQSAEMCAIYLQALSIAALRSIALDELFERSIFHLDNVRIPANCHSGQLIRSSLINEARRWRATWGECDWCTRYDFLGFHYDHVARTISMKESKRLAGNVSLTWPSTGRQWQSAVAKVIAYARALALSPNAYGTLAAMQRRISDPGLRDRHIDVSLAHRTQLCCTARLLSKSHPVAFEVARPLTESLKLYTDASLDGYAAVLCTTHTFRTAHGQKRFETINAGELYAVDQALRLFFFELKYKKVELCMDSQVGIACIRNATSTSRNLDKLVQRVTKTLNRLELADLVLTKVHTKENPADAPSRQRQVNVDLPSLRGIVEAVYSSKEPVADDHPTEPDVTTEFLPEWNPTSRKWEEGPADWQFTCEPSTVGPVNSRSPSSEGSAWWWW